MFRTRTLKCLYPLDLLHLGGISPKYFDIAPRTIKLLNDAGNFTGAAPEEDVENIIRSFLGILENHPTLITRIMAEFDSRKRTFLDVCCKVEAILPWARCDATTNNVFRSFNEQYYDCSALTWQAITLLPEAIERGATRIVDERNLGEQAKQECLATLTTPSQRSFMLAEEKALLKIAEEIKQTPEAAKMFRQEEAFDEQRLRVACSSIHLAIRKHLEAFRWIPFDYTGPAWNEGDIVERLRELLKKASAAEVNKEHDSEKLSVKRKKMALSLKLTAGEKKFFEAARKVMLLQDMRKELFSQAHYSINRFLVRLTPEIGISLEDIRHLTAVEISEVLLGGTPSIDLINERKDFWGGIFENDDLEIHSGETARQIERSIRTESPGNKDTLVGTPASAGLVSGVVRVITDEDDLVNFQQDEVLVTKMTTPAFVVVMRKAKAIVTDEGGITSHAAIVTRELGIPCIVGTKYATSVLKDGDQIEVNAYHGTVTKLRKRDTAPNKGPALATTRKSNQQQLSHEIRRPTPFTISLRDITPENAESVGGKASSLARLIGEFAVPDGFCITTSAFDEFVPPEQLRQIEREIGEANLNDDTQLRNVAKSAQRIILRGNIPTHLENAIRVEYEKMSDPVAVRSSSTVEDSAAFSAAGQHDTFLNIQGFDSLMDAIKNCWGSLYAVRAISYRMTRGIDTRMMRMALIVQEMVNAKKSGVVFTVNPVNQNRNEMVIEAVFGLGESLVAGRVEPDTYYVSKDDRSITQERIGVKHSALYLDGEIQLPENQQAKRVLSSDEIELLTRLALRVEERFGFPQDIEWAISDGTISILQSRPITTLAGQTSAEILQSQ